MPGVLLVGADDARGLLTAARSLARNGWRVAAVTPTPRSMIRGSRHVSHWYPLTSDIVGSVAAGAADGGYDVVLPGGDAEMFAISEGRDDLPCTVPYGDRESVRWVLDKSQLASQAERFGVAAPRTVEATDEVVDDSRGVMILKSASHAHVRRAPLVSADRVKLRRAAGAMRAAGVTPLLQERLVGPLLALSLVLGDQGEPLAAVQQRATALWPPGAGVSVRAHTVAVDESLLADAVRLLVGIGWRGLAQLQFIDAPDGPRLIDVNGRCYGSQALAAAAGVDLAAVWAGWAVGSRVTVTPPAAVGVEYQWLYGDIRRSWREHGGLLDPLRHAPKAAHSVWDRRDLRPSGYYVRHLAGSLARRFAR